MTPRAARLPTLAALALALCACTPRQAAHAPAVKPDADYAELGVHELGRRMAAGELTSKALTGWYLGRIAAIDDAGPTLAAVVEVNPEALAIAERLDAERAAGRVRGPLHGIPVLIKDNIDTADRMRTTACAKPAR